MIEAPIYPSSGPFLLQIDEVGAFVVFTSPSVTIGPPGSARPTDLTVLGPPGLSTIRICRCEEDYLVTRLHPSCPQAVVLANGQRLCLTETGFFWFRLPNPASTTAVLTPVGLRLGRCDIQSVLLADRKIMIGPTKGHHIRTALVDRTIVLVFNAGTLLVADLPGMQTGPLDAKARQLQMDRPNQVPPLVLVVSEYKPEV